MPTRYQNTGKSESHRSLYDDDEVGDKTNRSSRSHHSRNDSTAHRGSTHRHQGRDRDLTLLKDQDRTRRRRRPRSDTRRRRPENGLDEYYDYKDSEDSRRQDRKSDHRRRPRSRDHRSRRKHRKRLLSSSASISSQDSHHYSSRRSNNNRKRRRLHRGSRRNRSRSNTSSEHGSYREAYYHARDHGHDSRSDYHHHHHHHHRNPLHDGEGRHIPPAGVVSDDDDGYHHGEHQQHHRNQTKEHHQATTGTSSRWNPPSRPPDNHHATSPNTGQKIEKRQQHKNNNNNNNHDQHNNSKSSTKTNSHKKQRKGSPPPSNKIQDDTVGHFQGRDGCVIADRYRILKEVGVGTFGRVVECLDIKRRRRRHHWDDPNFPPIHDGSHCQRQQYHHRSPRERERHQDNPNNIVAIKIVRNVKRYYDSAKIEADIIRDVNRNGRRGRTHCAVMYDTFSFDGHYCMVFECLGPSLYDFLKGQKYHPFPIHCVRDFARQLLEALEFLHGFGLIHTDLKVRVPRCLPKIDSELPGRKSILLGFH